MKRCPTCSNVCLPAQAFCSACGGSLSEAAQVVGDPYLGTVLGGSYRLVKKLGEGGMGVVYRAESLEVGHTVAVKLLHDRFVSDEVAMKRFEREAQVASKLNHPNSISILDFGHTPSGASYLVMEFLDGVSLSSLLEREPLSLGQAISIMRQILSVLQAAHAMAIVHRDLKPANIFLIEREQQPNHVKVLDFGIARLRREGGSRVTRTGMVCGTPEYMSPEQARGFELDARSDLYSAGILLYEMLTNRRPFEGKSPAEVMNAQITDDVIPPSKRAPERGIPPSLDAIVVWALAKAPEDRLPSAVEFLRVVDAWAAVTRPGEFEPLELRCAGCRAEIPLSALKCPSCGTPSAPREGTRKRVELGSAEQLIREYLRTGEATGQHGSATESFDVEPATLTPSAVGLVALPSGWFEIPHASTLPLIGHQELLDELEQELVQPGLRLLRIVGAPGVGKRRLAGTLLGRLGSEGRRRIQVQPDPWVLAEPLGAIQRATTQLLELPCEPMSLEDLEEAVDPLELLEPHRYGLADLYNLGKPAGIGIEERRVLRAQAWRELVIAAAQRRPTALLFEDFERMDGATRELVQALSATATNASLAILISHRPEFVALWTPGFREIQLDGLPRADCEELALEITEGELEEHAVVRLAERSGGNPLHLIQLLAFYRNNQVSDPPRGLADIIAVRMSRLPSQLRLVLQAAAVFGDVVSEEALGEISEGGGPIKEALSELVSRVFLVSSVDGHRFIHPYVRQVVYSAIPAGIRSEIHSRVAQYLAEISPSPLLMAHHLWHSEVSREDALPQLIAAGEWALTVLDEEGASVAFRRALKLLPNPAEAPAAEPELRNAWMRVIFGLTAALSRSGDRAEAKVLLDSAKDQAAEAGWHAEAARLEVTAAL